MISFKSQITEGHSTVYNTKKKGYGLTADALLTFNKYLDYNKKIVILKYLQILSVLRNLS